MLEVLTILEGWGTKGFHPLKGGGEGGVKVLPYLEGRGAQICSNPRFSHFVAPFPIINDQTLRYFMMQAAGVMADDGKELCNV